MINCTDFSTINIHKFLNPGYISTMSGINPYILKQEFELPKVNYRITFLPMKKNVEVFSAEIPTEGDGLPGSILNTALSAGIDMEHSCGGV
ncbi:uncharacterized protein METZ01_LOCUS472174, partial [marine metagenome]